MIFVCACCNDKFSNDGYLEYQKHIEKKEKICIYCGIMTASVCALLNHTRTNHKKNEVSKCYKCLSKDSDSNISSCIHIKQYLRSLKAIHLLPEINNIKEELASENKTEGENEEVCKGCKKSFQNILRHLACTVWKSGINCKQFYTNELLQELKQNSQERLKRKKKERAPKYHRSHKQANEKDSEPEVKLKTNKINNNNNNKEEYIIEKVFISENITEGENENITGGKILEVCRGCKKSFQNILRHLACTVWKSGINCRQFYTDELFQEFKQKSQERLKGKKKERAPRYHRSHKLANARYRMSERGKEKLKQIQAKYLMSGKGKESEKQCQARYRMSKKGREKQKESDAKYSMSVKGKERQKRRSAKWRTSREANNCINKSDSEENKENNNISQLEVPLADIASNNDTEVMFLGSIDRDFSCKVTNCMSDFWFKSQLEEHIAKVHK